MDSAGCLRGLRLNRKAGTAVPAGSGRPALYGMYMLNTLVLACLKPIFNRFGPHHPLLQFPIALACTVIAAGLSYRFLETPFLKLKEWFSQLRSPKSPKVTAVASLPVQQS